MLVEDGIVGKWIWSKRHSPYVQDIVQIGACIYVAFGRVEIVLSFRDNLDMIKTLARILKRS